MKELRIEQVNRRHEETASFRADSSSSGSAGRSDIVLVKMATQIVLIELEFSA